MVPWCSPRGLVFAHTPLHIAGIPCCVLPNRPENLSPQTRHVNEPRTHPKTNLLGLMTPIYPPP